MVVILYIVGFQVCFDGRWFFVFGFDTNFGVVSGRFLFVRYLGGIYMGLFLLGCDFGIVYGRTCKGTWKIKE